MSPRPTVDAPPDLTRFRRRCAGVAVGAALVFGAVGGSPATVAVADDDASRPVAVEPAGVADTSAPEAPIAATATTAAPAAVTVVDPAVPVPAPRDPDCLARGEASYYPPPPVELPEVDGVTYRVVPGQPYFTIAAVPEPGYELAVAPGEQVFDAATGFDRVTPAGHPGDQMDRVVGTYLLAQPEGVVRVYQWLWQAVGCPSTDPAGPAAAAASARVPMIVNSDPTVGWDCVSRSPVVELPQVAGVAFTETRRGNVAIVRATATAGFVLAGWAPTVWAFDVDPKGDLLGSSLVLAGVWTSENYPGDAAVTLSPAGGTAGVEKSCSRATAAPSASVAPAATPTVAPTTPAVTVAPTSTPKTAAPSTASPTPTAGTTPTTLAADRPGDDVRVEAGVPNASPGSVPVVLVGGLLILASLAVAGAVIRRTP